MQDIYYDPSSPASFGGVRRLANATGKTLRKTRDWLMNEDTYTLHKPIKRRFLRRKVFVVGIDQLWQIDIADVARISSHNDGYKYILTIIDNVLYEWH